MKSELRILLRKMKVLMLIFFGFHVMFESYLVTWPPWLLPTFSSLLVWSLVLSELCEVADERSALHHFHSNFLGSCNQVRTPLLLLVGLHTTLKIKWNWKLQCLISAIYSHLPTGAPPRLANIGPATSLNDELICSCASKHAVGETWWHESWLGVWFR